MHGGEELRLGAHGADRAVQLEARHARRVALGRDRGSQPVFAEPDFDRSFGGVRPGEAKKDEVGVVRSLKHLSLTSGAPDRSQSQGLQTSFGTWRYASRTDQGPGARLRRAYGGQGGVVIGNQ